MRNESLYNIYNPDQKPTNKHPISKNPQEKFTIARDIYVKFLDEKFNHRLDSQIATFNQDTQTALDSLKNNQEMSEAVANSHRAAVVKCGEISDKWAKKINVSLITLGLSNATEQQAIKDLHDIGEYMKKSSEPSPALMLTYAKRIAMDRDTRDEIGGWDR